MDQAVLPTEIMTHILGFLDVQSDRACLCSCSLVSSTLRHISQTSLFRFIKLFSVPRAEELLSIFTHNPRLREYGQSIALGAPLLNGKHKAASLSEKTVPVGAAAQILSMLTDLRILVLQFGSKRLEGCTGAWALVPVDLQTALRRLLHGSSESPAKIRQLFLAGAQDFPADFITPSMNLWRLEVSGSAFRWQTLQPTAAIRARIDTMTASWDTAQEFATHTPVALSELRMLGITIDKEWNSKLGDTTTLFDACASSLSNLRIGWTTDTAAPPLRLNKPLENLRSLGLYLPAIDFQHKEDVENRSITAESALQWLSNSLDALAPAVALTDINIYIRVHCTTYPESWVGTGPYVIQESLILRPLSPGIQELWAAIDTTLSTPRNFPSLRQITLNTSLHFIDCLEHGQISQFAVALESDPEFDFEPLESYMELTPPRDRRRVKELFLRADSDLLPLTAERAHVEHEQSVSFERKSSIDLW